MSLLLCGAQHKVQNDVYDYIIRCMRVVAESLKRPPGKFDRLTYTRRYLEHRFFSAQNNREGMSNLQLLGGSKTRRQQQRLPLGSDSSFGPNSSATPPLHCVGDPYRITQTNPPGVSFKTSQSWLSELIVTPQLILFHHT